MVLSHLSRVISEKQMLPNSVSEGFAGHAQTEPLQSLCWKNPMTCFFSHFYFLFSHTYNLCCTLLRNDDIGVHSFLELFFNLSFIYNLCSDLTSFAMTHMLFRSLYLNSPQCSHTKKLSKTASILKSLPLYIPKSHQVICGHLCSPTLVSYVFLCSM